MICQEAAITMMRKITLLGDDIQMKHLEDVQAQDHPALELQVPDQAQDHLVQDQQDSVLQALDHLHSAAAHHQDLDEAARLKRKSRQDVLYL